MYSYKHKTRRKKEQNENGKCYTKQKAIEKSLWMRLLKITQTRFTISIFASKTTDQSKEANEPTSKINTDKKAMQKSHSDNENCHKTHKNFDDIFKSNSKGFNSEDVFPVFLSTPQVSGLK